MYFDAMRIFICLIFISTSSFTFSQEHKNILILYFGSNEDVLTNYSKKQLINILETAQKGELKIERVIGYSDSTGSEEYNKLLSERRINSVEKIISSYHFAIIEKLASGENYPENTTRLNDYANWRRVEIHYLIAPAVPDWSEEPQSVSFSKVDLESLGTKKQDPIVLNIQFVPGEDVLIGDSYNEIKKLSTFLKDNPTVFAFIRGHVCCDNDLLLSAARARVVFNILLNQGIQANRLRYEGMSNTIPAVLTEKTDEDRQKNRRVDVILSLIKN